MEEEVKIEGTIDINQALNEFEAKSIAEQIQKAPETLKNSEVPKMVQLVMKWSGVQEQKQAEYVLLGFVIVAIGISLFLVLRMSGGGKEVEFSPKVQQDMERDYQNLLKR